MLDRAEVAMRPGARRWALVAGLALLLAVGALGVWLGPRSDAGSAEAKEPAMLEPIAGSDLQRVRLTEQAAGRIDLRTVDVTAGPGAARETVVPYSSLLYDTNGATWVYTAREPLVFVRAPVQVDRIEGASAFLASGPPTGTPVVSVGAAELYGAELGVDH